MGFTGAQYLLCLFFMFIIFFFTKSDFRICWRPQCSQSVHTTSITAQSVGEDRHAALSEKLSQER